jgi:hypothetical protein
MIEEYFENISDSDLDFAIKEIYEVEKEEKALEDTMMLNNILNVLEEMETLADGMEFMQVSLLCMREYSYRKAGLK